MTRDQTQAHNTISLGKFAKRLGSAVGRFMEVSNLPPSLPLLLWEPQAGGSIFNIKN